MVALLHPMGQGSQIVIDRAVVLVGRSADCDAIIDFSSKISRMHCLLVQVDANYFIRDLGSLNGIRVNGERIAKEAQLVQGVEVAIGDVKYKFHANVQPAPRMPVRNQGATNKLPAFVDKSIPIVDAEIIDEEILDAEIIDDVEFADDVEIVDVIQDVEVVDDVVEVVDVFEVVDVIEDVEIIEDVDVIEDVEIIEDVEVVSDAALRARRRRRLN
jgi:predicted component of type VI protein secretion system